MKKIKIALIFLLGLIIISAIITAYVLLNKGEESMVYEDVNAIRLENRYLSVSFNKTDGSISGISDKIKQIEFIKGNKSIEAFRFKCINIR